VLNTADCQALVTDSFDAPCNAEGTVRLISEDYMSRPVYGAP
jgi:hypothetical protein